MVLFRAGPYAPGKVGPTAPACSFQRAYTGRMKTPLLALAALLAVAPLARASGDDAFAASLAAGAAFTPSAALRQAAQKPALPANRAAKAPSIAADEATWKKVLEEVKKDGKYTPETLMPGSFALEETIGDPKGDHTERAITVLGALNDDEKFEPMGAVIAVSASKADAATGGSTVDVWMFQTDIYGEVQQAAHATVVLDKDGKPVSKTADKLTPGDPKIKAVFDAECAKWAAYKPKA